MRMCRRRELRRMKTERAKMKPISARGIVVLVGVCIFSVFLGFVKEWDFQDF